MRTSTSARALRPDLRVARLDSDALAARRSFVELMALEGPPIPAKEGRRTFRLELRGRGYGQRLLLAAEESKRIPERVDASPADRSLGLDVHDRGQDVVRDDRNGASPCRTHRRRDGLRLLARLFRRPRLRQRLAAKTEKEHEEKRARERHRWQHYPNVNLKLIYNPAAGRGRTRRHVAAVEAYLRSRGARVDVHGTTSAADLTRVAAESSRGGYDRVVICGGDGSVHFAVRDFDLAAGTMAVIPLGSGDDFARVIGIPRHPEKACDAVLSGHMREVDVALANGIPYLGVAGLGFDSQVGAFANQVKHLRGSAVYVYAIFRVLPRFEPHLVRITTGNGTRAEQIMFAVVGNSRQYGGGIRIVPDAVIDDGILDYCIVHKTTRLQLLKTLPLAYSGAHVRRSYVETGRGQAFRFECDTPLDVNADGEFVTTTPVEFRLGGRLRVAVP